MFRAILIALFILNTATGTDYTGRLAAEEQKGGDSSLDGKDALVSPLTENPPGDVLAPDVTPAEGASENRSLLPDDSAPLPFSFNAEDYTHLIQAGDALASCVYLGDGWFVTAYHLFKNNPKYNTDKSIRIDGNQYGGRLYMFADADQVYLQMTNIPEDWASCKLCPSPLTEGQELRVFGLTTCSHDGKVDLSQKFSGNLVKVDFVNGDVAAGDSGGGVFDDQGRLVAVICENIVDDHLGALVSPVAAVASRLPAIPSLEKVVAPTPPNEEDLDKGTKYLLFTATWCPPCKETKRTVLPKLEEAGYTVTSIDWDIYPALVKKYNITGLPTYVYIIDGVESGRSVNGHLQDILNLADNTPK